MVKLKVGRRSLHRKPNSIVTVNQEISVRAVKESIRRIALTGPYLALGTTIVVLTFYLFVETATDVEQTWRNSIIITNLIVSVGSLLSAFIASKALKQRATPRFMSSFLNMVIAFVLVSGLAITLIDQLVVTNLTPLMISMTIVSTFYILRPLKATMIFIIFFILFYLGMVSLSVPSPTLSSTVVNGLVITLVGSSLSLANWTYFRRGELQERKIVQQQNILERMAYHDPLTKLPNRRFLDQIIKNEVAKVKRGQTNSCLIIMDIDDFKLVNDTHGHPTGDEVLKEFATVVSSSLRASDTFVRLGGEEFLILAPDSTLDAGLIFAERLRQTVSEHKFTANGDEITITVSIGIASLKGIEKPLNYYSNADKALYKAKNKGKNRIEAYKEIS